MRYGDPPPYLRRMQQLGYPPGYLGNANEPEAPALQMFEDSSTLSKFSDAGKAVDPVEGEKPLVDFPGLNVPPPHGSDPRAWNWSGPITR